MSGDPDPPEGGDRTVFMPSTPPSTPPAAAPTSVPPASEPPRAATSWGPAPTGPPQQVGPGSVLNNIYEVKRFIGRGGMGEVYEGFNVNTDERVAIKVMLPSLAADANVQAMFKKEARTLTRLHHPAVVPYRVLAVDQQLGVLYIVTEFIDGPPLSDVLAEMKPTGPQLRQLIRRLAEGLGSAHALGLVHRDMSPDNVLLPERRLDQAKIIDFGIAKDMDPGKGTIVGDGFAGKLGYVAPEQFGDYNREVGPWTDVYSLGLVALAVANGRDVDMGATLVEAVDRRRAGPDLSIAPEELRPVLAQMLAPDPTKRLRSMEEVVAALDAPVAAPSTGKAKAKPAAPKPAKPPPAEPTGKRRSPLPLILGGGLAALVVVGGAAVVLLPKMLTSSPPPAAATTAGAAPAQGQTPEAVQALQSIEATLPKVACSWLDVADFAPNDTGVSVRLRGVAGDPSVAQTALSNAASTAGAQLTNLSLDEVAPVGTALCTTLNVLREFRNPQGTGIDAAQRKFVISRQDDGKVEARAVINLTLPESGREVAIVGVEPNGTLTPLITSRDELKAAIAAGAVTDLGNGAYRLLINTTHTGWSGILFLTGQGPFDRGLLQGDESARGEGWPDGFRAPARAGGWTTEMVWYRTVNPGEG